MRTELAGLHERLLVQRAALEAAGADVIEYEGAEISVKGAGGPTCLTRPLTRLRPMSFERRGAGSPAKTGE